MFRFGVLGRVLAAVTVASLFVFGLNALPASALSSSSAVSDGFDDFTAQDFVSAQIKAKTLGHKVLVVDELSDVSTSWVNADGTVTTDVAGSPVRVRDGSGRFGWRDLDYTLQFASDGSVQPVSGLYPLSLSGGGTAAEVAVSGLVSVSGSGGLQIGFGWSGVLPKPVLNGECALYSDVLTDVDIRVCLTSNGFEQFFILKAKPSQEVLNALALPLNLSHATVVSDGNGGFSFKDATGGVVGSVPTPSVQDSADLPNGDSTVLQPDLAPSNVVGSASPVLRLNVDATYFDDPSLVYPVVVDPQVSLGASFNTYVSSANPTTDYSSASELLVGTPDAGVSKYRSYLNFDGSAFAGATVTSASLKLWLNWSWSCTPTALTVYAAKPVSSTTRWGAQPTIYTNYSGSISSAAGYNSSCPAGVQTIDVTSPIAAEAKSNWPTAGLTLRASETASSGWKRFYSANASTHKPQLSVTYNHVPVITVNPAVVGGVTAGATVYTGDVQPTFTTVATDSDAQKLSYTFKYLRTSGINSWWVTACSTGPLASGVKASCQSIPTLTDQTTYSVYVDVSDGTDVVSSANALTVVADLAAPTAPTMATCPYNDNSWTPVTPTAPFSCNLQTVTGATIFYSVDGGAYQNGNGRSVSVNFPAGMAQHVVEAYTLGASGLVSSTFSYVFSVGTASLISPKTGTETNNGVTLSAFGRNSTGAPTSARLWFENAAMTSYQSAEFLPITTKNGVSGVYDYDLNLAAYTGAIVGAQDVGFEVCFSYSAAPVDCSNISFVLYNPNSFTKNQPTQTSGGGQLNLANGDFSYTADDVSLETAAGGFNIQRVLTTNTAVSNQFSGNGWQTIISGSQTGLSTYDLTTVSNGLVIFDNHQGGVLVYQVSGAGYVPLTASTSASRIGLTSTGSGASQKFVLKESNLWTTTFVQNSTGWVFGSVTDPSGTFSYCTTFDNSNKPLVLRQAPGNISNLCSTIVAGTKELQLSYGTSKTGGDFTGYLKNVTFNTYNTANLGVTKTVSIANYVYDSAGNLLSVTDPRNGLTTSYTYETYSYATTTLTRLLSVQNPGVTATRFFYSGNKLIRVGRDKTLNPSDGFVIENTYLYGASYSSANLPTITADKNLWGQTINPAGVTITFGADTNIAYTTANTAVSLAALTAAQLKQGCYTYFDAFGRESNTASWGLTKWLYSYQKFDTNNNIVTSFTPEGIDALQQRIVTEPSIDVHQFATDYRYNEAFANTAGALLSGVQLLDIWGPAQTSTTAGVTQTLRPHTHNTYDQNAPNSGVNPTTGMFYGLLTSTKTGLVAPAAALSGQADDVVLGETKTSFDDQVTGHNQASNTSGWVLGKPTKTSFYDPTGLLIGENVTVYNSYGQTTQNAGVGQTITNVNNATTTSPMATSSVYYSSATNSSKSVCGSHPENVGLLCWSGNTLGDASPLPSTLVSSYDFYGNPLTSVETGAGNTTRTTTNTYRVDGRLATTSVAVSNLSSNVATSGITTLYDSATGAVIGQQPTGAPTSTQEIQMLDTWGRVSKYTNSAGDETTTTYVPYGNPGAGQLATETTINTSGATVVTNSYTYDGTDILGGVETRGLLTKKTVTTGATQNNTVEYNAAYNELGALAKQTSTGGLSQTYSYDENGRLTDTSYNGTDTTSGTPTDVTWFTWSKTFDTSGKISTLTGPSNAFNGATTATKTFGYDTNHHLNTVTTQGLGVTDCSQNSYSFDQFGDKTTITKGVGSAGACQTTATTKNQTFNAYSQLTTAGYVYDALGRNTTIPAADTTTGTSNINLVYDSTDNVTNITQGSNITTYGYDASGRNQTQTSGGVITTDHFTDTSDSANYTTQKTIAGVLQQTDTYAGAIGDGLNVTVSVPASGLPTSKAQIIDPLGSVVANITIPTTGNAAGPDSFQSFDEYGNPETPATPQTATQTSIQNFGWAGTANRQTETTGLILMGARVYNPVTGQFTSPDPIPGGNENTYTYPNDPINGNDFTGCWGASDWIGLGGLVFGTLITAAACAASAGVACLVVGLVVGGVSGALESGAKAAEEHLSPHATLKAMAFGALVGMATGSFGGKIGKAAKILYRARNAFHVAGSKLRGAGFIEKIVGAATDYGSNKLIGLVPPPPQRRANKTNNWPKRHKK